VVAREGRSRSVGGGRRWSENCAVPCRRYVTVSPATMPMPRAPRRRAAIPPRTTVLRRTVITGAFRRFIRGNGTSRPCPDHGFRHPAWRNDGAANFHPNPTPAVRPQWAKGRRSLSSSWGRWSNSSSRSLEWRTRPWRELSIHPERRRLGRGRRPRSRVHSASRRSRCLCPVRQSLPPTPTK
jgi:hypothetical protein